jgi:hypothetical protein
MRTFQEIIEDAGYSPRSYSGRGMYGKECLGAELTSQSKIGRFISDVLNHIDIGEEDAPDDELQVVAEAFRSMQWDSLGLGMIVYFEWVEYKDEYGDEDDYDDDDDEE